MRTLKVAYEVRVEQRGAHCAVRSNSERKTKQTRPSQAEPGSEAGTTRTRQQAATKPVTQTHIRTNGQAVMFLAYHTPTDRNIMLSQSRNRTDVHDTTSCIRNVVHG